MEWEQYFDENKLKTIMEEAGCEVNVLSQIDANDEKEGIFSAWIGMVKK